jgi:hypothetical protein
MKGITGSDRVHDFHVTAGHLDVLITVKGDGPQRTTRDDHKRGTLFLPGASDFDDVCKFPVKKMDIFFACFDEIRRPEKFEQLLIIVGQAANDGGPDIGVDADKPPSLLAPGERKVSRGYRLDCEGIGTEGKRADVGRKARLQIRKVRERSAAPSP